jgi:hypothetical protein
MTNLQKITKEIESATEEGLGYVLWNILPHTNLFDKDEKEYIKEMIEVRRQVLWFNSLPNIIEPPKPTSYVHFNPKRLIPKRFQTPLEVCTKSKCVFKCDSLRKKNK